MELLRVTIPEADMGFCAITCNLSSAGSCNVGLSEIRCTGGHDRPGPRCKPGVYVLVLEDTYKAMVGECMTAAIRRGDMTPVKEAPDA